MRFYILPNSYLVNGKARNNVNPKPVVFCFVLFLFQDRVFPPGSTQKPVMI